MYVLMIVLMQKRPTLWASNGVFLNYDIVWVYSLLICHITCTSWILCFEIFSNFLNFLDFYLLQGIKEISSRANIGVKRMGELDTRAFLEAMKRKYNAEDAEDRASELCSLWEEYLKDPDWHPFKIATIDEGKHQVCLS